ncbi:ubiquitin 3 binding protein But2 C-terminal domain-containing protein [Apiospora arundinis]|uniref:Ubiquitin 3 binding protein But2 C-terminal domain-containing protein n=1 Tax=Apiospora arundinis TaxID=335852 RepID=A0ABR2HSI6_9PEZI
MLVHLPLLVGSALFNSLGQGNPLGTRANVGCTFHLSVDAGGSPPIMYPVGQIYDGLCRARGDLDPSTFTWFGDAFVDKQGRGCWWTPPSKVLQCDPSQQMSHGFEIDCTGRVTFSGKSTFFACQTDGDPNIYLEPNGAQCQPITLVADGCKSTCCDCDSTSPSAGSVPRQINGRPEAPQNSKVPDNTHPFAAADAQVFSMPSPSQVPSPLPLSPPTSDCPANIIWTPYEKPQLIIPVDRANPTRAYGPTYLGQVSQNASTVFNMEIPPSYAGKSCKVFFSFPTMEQMASSNGSESYYFGGSGGISFARLAKPALITTTWEDVFGSSNETGGGISLGQTTISPGYTFVVETFACPAGQTLTYLMMEQEDEDTYLVFMQNDVPVALGLFMSVC